MSKRRPGEASGYDAFICYSHGSGAALARALQTGLERFAKPWYRPRALRVFSDTTSLTANPGPWSSIEKALASSTWLVLMASPDAARSEWVNREIGWWLANKSPHRLLVVLTEGDFVWNEDAEPNDGATAALPPALRGAFGEEPRWIDLRWLRHVDQLSSDPRWQECLVDISTTIREVPKDELVADVLGRDRRRVRLPEDQNLRTPTPPASDDVADLPAEAVINPLLHVAGFSTNIEGPQVNRQIRTRSRYAPAGVRELRMLIAVAALGLTASLSAVAYTIFVGSSATPAIALGAVGVILSAVSIVSLILGYIHRTEFLGAAKGALINLRTVPEGYVYDARFDVESRDRIEALLVSAHRLRDGLLVSGDTDLAIKLSDAIRGLFGPWRESLESTLGGGLNL